MEDLPWYRTIFDEQYLRVYGPLLTPERTEREVEGIVTLLDLAPGSAILDLACGHGRHAIPLALRGYPMTGQDLSERFLRQAEADARAQGAEVRWVHGDMRMLAPAGLPLAAYYGGLNGCPLTMDSNRLAVVSRKEPEGE